MPISKELDTYYSERLSMMGSQGWKDLIEDVEGMIASTNTLNGVSDEKTLHFKKGELSIMMWIKGLREMSQKSYEDLKNETTL